MTRQVLQPRVQHGFTLLEVLVAFTIAAGAVLTILYAFAGGLWRLQSTNDYGIAAMVAESRLVELGVIYPVETGNYSGASEDGQYSWNITIEPYLDEGLSAPEPQAYQLYDVVVDVIWEHSGGARQFVLYSQKAARSGE